MDQPRVEAGSGTPAVLVAAALDPTGGAGLTQDVGFLSRLGVRTAPVLTAVAARDDRRLRRLVVVDSGLFREQLEAAVETLGQSLAAIKTGLVASLDQSAAVADLARRRHLPLVVDPLLAAEPAAPLHKGHPTALVEALIVQATLLTPNIAEAEILSATTWDTTREGLLALARTLASPRRIVAVSGGAAGTSTVPLAVAAPGLEKILDVPRAERGSLRGAGCALAAAAAGYIAIGIQPREAIFAAHRLVAAAVAASRGVSGLCLTPECWSV